MKCVQIVLSIKTRAYYLAYPKPHENILLSLHPYRLI